MRKSDYIKESRIAILFIGDLFYCPYLSNYTELLDNESIKYDVIYWNRSCQKQVEGSNYICFNKESKLRQNKIKKTLDFFQYRKWLINFLEKRKYDKLIILSSIMAFLLMPYIMRYKHKYIFDIRDYSYELFKLYYIIEKVIIDNSLATVISSKAFESFLPKNRYYYTHNLSVKRDEKLLKYRFSKKDSGRINVVWMGALRYFKHQVKIIEKLGNDERFNVYYHGEGSQSDIFFQYIRSHNYNNVFFTGRYDNEDKKELILKADILNNSYPTQYETAYALSNKFYDGAFYHIPQIVEGGTYKCTLTEKYYLGIAIEPDDPEFADKLYNYYTSIDVDKFNRGCYQWMEIVRNHTYETKNIMLKFIESNFD